MQSESGLQKRSFCRRHSSEAQVARIRQVRRADWVANQVLFATVPHVLTWEPADAPSKFYGQAERAISTGKLHALLRFHIQPIKHVVFVCPSLPLGLGDLILRSASRLYAFSVYHNRTSLPSRAIGMTAGTQEVRPSRSSRTKDRSSQISYAHIR